jgi:hypothetical protein
MQISLQGNIQHKGLLAKCKSLTYKYIISFDGEIRISCREIFLNY